MLNVNARAGREADVIASAVLVVVVAAVVRLLDALSLSLAHLVYSHLLPDNQRESKVCVCVCVCVYV